MNFNEKSKEYSPKQGKEVDVWQSPKYLQSKDKAIEIINSGLYGVTEADFWILMNETKGGKMAYTGLIISHNGCLKINEKLENKVKPECFHVDKEGYNNSLVYTYMDSDTYEVGEVSKENCKNAYPNAMALKRCFDRVVLKKSRLAYAGIYSEAEAEEFKEPVVDNTEVLKQLKDNQIEWILGKKDIFKIETREQITQETVNEFKKMLKEKKRANRTNKE